MTRAYFCISSGDEGIRQCPYCKPKSSDEGKRFGKDKSGPISEREYLEFGESEGGDLPGCLNQSSVSRLRFKTPQSGNSSRSLLREIRIRTLNPDSLVNQG